MIYRYLLLIVSAVSLAACSSYETALVDGKVPIYPIEQKDYSEVLRMMVDTTERLSTEMVALAPKQEGKSSGSLTIKPWWGIADASGKLEDGSTAHGMVLGDRFSCRGKEVYPGQRQKFKDLHDRMTQELAAKFKSRWEPQYVAPETLELQ